MNQCPICHGLRPVSLLSAPCPACLGLCASEHELQASTPEEIALGIREYLDRENVAAIEAGDSSRELATERALEIARNNFPLA